MFTFKKTILLCSLFRLRSSFQQPGHCSILWRYSKHSRLSQYRQNGFKPSNQILSSTSTISPSDVKYQANATAIARIAWKHFQSDSTCSDRDRWNPFIYLLFRRSGVLSADGRILTIALGDLKLWRAIHVYHVHKTAQAGDMPAEVTHLCHQ
jgi:hypothetical protein